MLSICLALVFTKAMFTSYNEEQVMTRDGNIYLLKENMANAENSEDIGTL